MLPRCVQCMRQSLLGDASLLPTPFYRQLRGKKRTAKRSATIKVKLRGNIRGYGSRGSIIDVAPGRMRNIWYPNQMAEYITGSQLREQREVVAERDFTFGTEKAEESTAEEEEEMIDVEMKLLDPGSATALMDILLPPEIVFYRTPIPSDEKDDSEPAVNPSKDIHTPDSSATLEPSARESPTVTPIYGSISVLDIRIAVQELLARDEDGKRIVPSVSIIHEKEKDGDDRFNSSRIKALGSFPVNIRVKSGSPLRRTIVVKASEEEPLVAE